MINQDYYPVKPRRFASEDVPVSEEKTQTQCDIEQVCREVMGMLLEKNRKYGDSALNPVRIFSRCTPEEAILVRMDDKLSRLRSGQSDEDEDVYLDLIGYLVLLRVSRMQRGR